MDKQLEQRIRERAYELWMQHGSLPGRAEEYWYQAEQEILGQQSNESGSSLPSDAGQGEVAPVETSPAPLGMTSQTLDEVLSSPATPKPRKRKDVAAAAADAGAEVSEGGTVAAPKRRRSKKTST
ncbi:DUF2934 domain-containing protein [Microvirga makkahensis]|uniref:DUF2934 domain-containing protein n=1 Tax=Microvirga makkahensis TaxID=1128670 RepID=A0A7X3SM92_9HYPH|nr:DUF2934 domain-containing protein [Microvirga makkahensis]MXQ10071.1 DUF2934 domain-containing protein [Microvirga makkahensis]